MNSNDTQPTYAELFAQYEREMDNLAKAEQRLAEIGKQLEEMKA